ncbi:MAG: NAD-dependent epimerase/dehydratase family protein [Candidatus Peribacteraceae bacterium]|nr:NAD-dependent epimerase/dehydratase family protein [Candidatus Peribacteraceae bacterium]
MSKERVLITGGLGAIGAQLSRTLLKKGVESLTIIDDFSSSSPHLVSDIIQDPRVTHFRRSIIHDECLRHALLDRKQDVVFHLAANFAHQSSLEHPVIDCEVNSLGTVKVLEYSRRANVKKFVFASSSCVYGNAKCNSVDNKDYHLDTPYAINKLHGEFLVDFNNKHHSMNTTILRYFNSFGPGELPGRYRNVIPNFFAMAMQGKALPISGDEKTSRDFNFVDNTVSGTLLAAEKEIANGKIYNIGSGHEITIVELAETINRIVGNKAGITFVPQRTWDTIKNRRADVSKTEKELGYKAVIDFENHLHTTHDWLKQYKDHFPSF